MPRKVTEKALGGMKRLEAEEPTYRRGSLEKLAVKMRKWEPVRRKILQDEISISKGGIDIFAWAVGHFKGYKRVDLYIDDKRRLLGIKPAANGQRSLVPKVKGRGFSVVCTPLMKQFGVNERKRVPAEWSEKGKMLLIDLRGYRKASASTKLK